MNNKKILAVSCTLIIFFMILFSPFVVFADEANNENLIGESENNTIEGQINNENNDSTVVNTDNQSNEISSSSIEDQTETKNATITTNNNTVENQRSDEKNNREVTIEDHKVAVITTKVDENGKPLKGAVLQILNSSGKVVDEWISNGKEHKTMLTEGKYTLHEVSAPKGYKKAKDKTFTVKVEVVDIEAGVDFSETPCEHYGGTPLYYVEIQGKKYEVYCINQDWETPDENSIYDGEILNPSDIKNFTTQTVYIDAHQNKASMDISDQSLSSQELYNKILDIIYHRQKASSIFTDLTEAEIRYVTESALKNYTNAGLTRVQRVAVSQAPTGYENTDYYITDDGRYIWYLYPWYRSFVYDPDAPLGKDIFKTVIGEGDAFGNLARHWSAGHNAKNSEEVRALIARYYELYLYLISSDDPHPSDMHLYIFFTDNKATDLSGYNFDDGAYQNLLGVRWYNPDDNEHTIYLTLKNELDETEKPKEKEKQKHKKEIYKKIYSNPKTSDNIMSYIIVLSVSLGGLGSCSIYRRKEDLI